MAERDDAGAAAYEKTIKDPKPLDPAFAAQRLKEVKSVFDELGVFFWLSLRHMPWRIPRRALHSLG